MSRYFYARVSTKDQNPGRQLEVARNYKDRIDLIFVDKQSGKNFDRTQYQKMKGILESGDEVIVKELDRLGRNSALVKEELKWFKDNGVTVRILDIPTTLLDFGEQDWVREMVTNILVEVLSSMAEQERKKTQTRRKEGIEAMPVVDGKRVSAKTGRGFGRPKKEVEPAQLPGETVLDACNRLGISKRTWYRLVNQRAESA